MVLLVKKQPLSVENTRPIECTNFTRKLMETVWLRLAEDYLWKTVHPNQLGFRPERQMGENTQKLLSYMKQGRYNTILYVDLKGAFPSVNQPIMLRELRHRLVGL
jgi:hypothetical protein